MATYQFAFITSPEAQGYQAARDDLRFDGVSGATATTTTVQGLTIRVSNGGSVTLGLGAAGDTFTFPDGSKLALPSDAADTISGSVAGDQLLGGGGGDVLHGSDGGDILDGGNAVDTLTGGAGADTLTGGAGYDHFVFAPGESGVVEGQVDAIVGWEAQFEKLVFSTPMSGGDYAEITAASFAAALQAANQQIATGTIDVVAAQVGSDVVVFADSRNNNGGADDAIVLRGRNLTFMDGSLITGLNPGGANPNPNPNPNPDPNPNPNPTPLPGGTLIFEQLTAAQALAYNGAIHDLQFVNASAGQSATLVFFDPGGTVSIVSGVSGNRTVTFGSGMHGETNLIFPDNTRVVIGTPADDILSGAHTHDSVYGGPGNDTLYGAGNPDTLRGGDGADLFVALPRDTLPSIFDVVGDWQSIDRITFGGSVGATAANYREYVQGEVTQNLITTGQADYVAIQRVDIFGQTVVDVLADVFGTNTVTGRIELRGATLETIDFSHIVAAPALALPSLAPTPGQAQTAAPGPPTFIGPGVAIGATGSLTGNMDQLRLGALRGGLVGTGDATLFRASTSDFFFELNGTDFSYLISGGDTLVGIPTGTVTRLIAALLAPSSFSSAFNATLSIPPTAASTVFDWVLTDATSEALNTIFAGSDSLYGDAGHDLLRGFAGHDTLGGFGGNDSVFGGLGNDVIYALGPPGRISPNLGRTGSTYLRGEEGDDLVIGNIGFDDINGNMGNDTAGGGLGDDWVVGGKDNDLLFGDAGNDLVYGNLGADTCHGGEGADIVRGGQDDDLLFASAGDDFISGDRGNDTLSGGAGADIFNTFAETGIDRVTDFSAAEGDRVQLAPGTQYTLAQAGPDTVINTTGGGQMILVGVQLSSLPQGWIFGA